MKEISRFDEILIKKYFLNETTLKNNIKDVNFNLLFSHYPRFDESEKKFIFYISKDKIKNNRGRDDKWLLGNKPEKIKVNGQEKDTDKYRFFAKNKVEKTATQYYDSIANLGYQTQEFSKEPDWRMVIGLGGESVYETGMTLHHIYGFPYIPATAIKGIAHHYATELEKEKKFDKEQIDAIFGVDEKEASDKQAKRGKIIFFDAFPTGEITLSPDIMNNHYPDYYDGGKKPPADWQSPRPIFFLTVKETSFKFVLGIKPKDQEQYPNLLAKAIKLLEEALTQKGIGAKTAVGYGYMQ
jgi:CRISPR-associated protein Cmr6